MESGTREVTWGSPTKADVCLIWLATSPEVEGVDLSKDNETVAEVVEDAENAFDALLRTKLEALHKSRQDRTASRHRATSKAKARVYNNQRSRSWPLSTQNQLGRQAVYSEPMRSR